MPDAGHRSANDSRAVSGTGKSICTCPGERIGVGCKNGEVMQLRAHCLV
jgi:hypothetical protein